jgi:aspartate kinase
MGVKVCKFGGSSVADAAQLRKVQAIVDADSERRFIVPSAPGKRSHTDQKITDLLYLCSEHAKQGVAFDEVFSIIADRYQSIVRSLSLDLDLDPHLEQVKTRIAAGEGPAYAASRGEYLNGLIVAKLLSAQFIDAAEIVCFDEHGRFLSTDTNNAMSEKLVGYERVVVPGFYGSAPDGAVKTFSRGGSDITGAIVARGVRADVYENWTDVSGLLMTDPRIVENPKAIRVLTYRELRELAYMGATVLHDEAIFPVREAGIPVQIRNTNSPEEEGTLIIQELPGSMPLAGDITGVAGRKGFTVLAIEKTLMNTEIGFARRMLSALERQGVSFEHMPSGIDTISLVMQAEQIDGRLDAIVDEIRAECEPDRLEIYEDIALIATVGRGMSRSPGMASRLFGALAAASVNIRMIDQGSSELNIIVGVESVDFEKAVRAIYETFA